MKKFILVLSLLFSFPAFAQNYQATQGAGTTFGSKLVTAVNYPQFVVCDPTTPAQCAAVDASGRLSLIPNTAINIAQINGVTVLMGNGATGTGSQRITIANDNTIPTGWPTAANQTVVNTWASGTLGAMAAYGTSPGAVLVPGVNAFVTNTTALGQAAMGASSPVVIASNQTANALWGHGVTGAAVPANATYMGFNSGGNLTAPSITAPLPVNQAGPYPIGAVPYTATATGTTAATTATLAGAASVTTYICGFSIRANATVAATGNATVTGVITATLNFTQWTAPNASGLGITEMIFSPCVPASGTNQSVAVVSAAPGTGGVVSVSAWGYKL